MTLFKIPHCCCVWQIHPGCTLSFIVYWTAKIHPLCKRSINNSRVIKHKGWTSKGCFFGLTEEEKMQWWLEECCQVLANNFRSTAGSTLIFLNHVEAEGQALVRYLAVDEDPEGTEHVWVIWSRLSAFTDSNRQTKADWKQRLTVYYFCWGVSVRNSPLICFILFYEAVTPNRVWDLSVGLFLRVPPVGAPCLFSGYQSCSWGTCVLH